ncbi:MAG TPA: aldo/keto reductase [Blastocatellia bacterium]|nr:aldo/keto reductase [Blastocatellia bacterium]
MSSATGATAEGTRRYADRLIASGVASGHFRKQEELCFSSVGIGTYLGHWDERTDRMYIEAIKRAVELGSNVIDSAINYRFQRSERAIGQALKQVFDAGKAARDEIIVATKGGFIPFEDEPPRDARQWIMENLINNGVARPEDIVGGSHCMSPSYLEDQLNRSLENLGLERIDIYYVHNPESQFQAVSGDEFDRRLRAAFEFLERAVADGRIGLYGTATWNGYRQPPNTRGYLSLAGIEKIAREVAGERHHFRVIQLPYNLAMPEAITEANQTVDGEQLSALMAAGRLGITVMCSASILQAKLAQNLPPFIGEALTGLKTDAQRAIQFVRSTPGVTTALVGMSQRPHVEENLAVAKVPPASVEDFFKIFSSEEA